MAVFDIISNYGYESNPTTLTFTSGIWNLFTIGSSLYIKNTSVAGSTPSLIIPSVTKYNAVRLGSYDVIIIHYMYNNTLYKLLINVASTVYTLGASSTLGSNILGFDCVAISNYMRVVYVDSLKIMTINDYTYPTDTIPNEHYEIQLNTEDNYQYHIINLENIQQIIVYYIDTTDNKTVYENTYTILTNVITITPPTGDKYVIYTANLANVDLNYASLVITASEGILTVLDVNESAKTATFRLNSNIKETKTLTFSDGVDTFEAELYNTYQNTPPYDINLSSNTIYEGYPTHTTIGTLSTDDLDPDNTFTYELDNGTGFEDNSSFTITDNVLYSSGIFNYETKSSYLIRVKTTDNNGASFSKSFVVLVLNINETPNDIYLSSNAIEEGLPVDTLIGTLTTNDPDYNNTFVYELDNGTGFEDNQYFTITGDSLKSNLVFDYETKSSYTIRVKTTDDAGLSYSRGFNILVINLNEAPTDMHLSSNTIHEGVATATFIGTLTSDDPDGDLTFTYALDNGVGYEDNSAFSIVGDALQSNLIYNYEAKSNYIIRIKSTDNLGASYSRAFNILILNVNEAPTTILLSNNYINERVRINTFLGKLTTLDPDRNDTATYTLVAGVGSDDNSKFKIVGREVYTNAIIKYRFQQNAVIRVRSTDAGGLFTEQRFVISILEVVDPAIRARYLEINAKRPYWPYRIY